MKRFRLIGLALVALCAFGAVLSASAFALPEFLPLNASTRGFTGKADGSVGPILENSAGTKVECTTAEGSGGLETDTLGTFHITFSSCSSSGVKCTTEGDTTGLILSEGSYHFVYDTLGTGETLGIAILFLPKETDFSCLGGLLNNKVKGTVLCLILTPLVVSLTHLFHCLPGAGKGEALEKKYWLDNGSPATVQLLSNLNEGGFKESNEQALSTITTKEAASWMNE